MKKLYLLLLPFSIQAMDTQMNLDNQLKAIDWVAKNPTEENVKWFRDIVLDRKQTDQYGNTILHKIAQNGDFGLVKIVNPKPEDVLIKNHSEQTPLDILKTSLFQESDETNSEKQKECLDKLTPHCNLPFAFKTICPNHLEDLLKNNLLDFKETYDENGNTIMHTACNQIVALKTLSKYAPNSAYLHKNNKDQTPLDSLNEKMTRALTRYELKREDEQQYLDCHKILEEKTHQAQNLPLTGWQGKIKPSLATWFFQHNIASLTEHHDNGDTSVHFWASECHNGCIKNHYNDISAQALAEKDANGRTPKERAEHEMKQLLLQEEYDEKERNKKLEKYKKCIELLQKREDELQSCKCIIL